MFSFSLFIQIFIFLILSPLKTPGPLFGLGIVRRVLKVSNICRLEIHAEFIFYLWCWITQSSKNLWRLENLKSTRLVGENVLQEIVTVANSHPQEVHRDGVAEEQGESQQDPGEVRRVKCQEAKEIHSDIRISSGPNVHQHDGKCLKIIVMICQILRIPTSPVQGTKD